MNKYACTFTFGFCVFLAQSIFLPEVRNYLLPMRQERCAGARHQHCAIGGFLFCEDHRHLVEVRPQRLFAHTQCKHMTMKHMRADTRAASMNVTLLSTIVWNAGQGKMHAHFFPVHSVCFIRQPRPACQMVGSMKEKDYDIMGSEQIE